MARQLRSRTPDNRRPVDPAPITELTLRAYFHQQVPGDEVHRWMDLGIEPGWTATIDQLGPYLAR